jgi:pimeloyl-ACP methyl ester carboxylesterase
MINTMNISDYYEYEGSGEPIVFIHGSYANTTTWKVYFKRLLAFSAWPGAVP